eukprot:c24220_g1_i1 orf=104-1417(+)
MASLKSYGLSSLYAQTRGAEQGCELIKGTQFLHGEYVNFRRSVEGKMSIRTVFTQDNRLRLQCAILEKETKVIKKTLLHDLYEKENQSPWYDNLRRPVSDLKPYIENGVRGVTSNPTIFQKAISSSNAYDDQFRQLISEGKDIESAYWGLVVKDIQDACDLFKPLFNESNGADGYVSVEVSPNLAHETDETVEAAKNLYSMVNRPNVHIKIPATAQCVPAIKKVISLGINVNVTLIFSLPRYEAVIDAYLEGLEALDHHDLSGVASVASFFVSRVDTLVDRKLQEIGTEEALSLLGKAANAQAALAYKLYQDKFSGPRWEALLSRGGRKQRLLWASTSVKNPAYPDTHYVSPLIGSDTVSTMPDAALEAFINHGKVSRTIDANLDEARRIYEKIEELGIQWADVGSLLEMEGVDSFKKSFDDLLSALKKKASLISSK